MRNRCNFLIGIVLACAIASSASAMDISLLLRLADSGAPVTDIDVQFVFNPGTSAADTITGTTDAGGMLHITHDLVSSVPDTPPLALSSPYPNPAGSTAVFGLSGGDKSYGALTFSLFDLRGRRVGYGNVGTGGIALPRPLTNGTYLYRVTDGSEVRIRGKLAVLGRLERVEFRTGHDSGNPKFGADPVDILIRSKGFEEYIDSRLLAEGQHYLQVTLAMESDCELCKIFVADIAEQAAEAGVSTYQGMVDLTMSGCEIYSQPLLRSRCESMVYPNASLIADQLYSGASPEAVCFGMGVCILGQPRERPIFR